MNLARSKRLSKRFKKFHRASRRIPHYFKGYEAKKEILRILKENEAALNLAREVTLFYGNYLKLYEDTSYSTSQFIINLAHKPVKLQFVAIRLQLGTNRIAEALTHELLHLRLFIQGFPIVEIIDVPDEQDKYASNFDDIIQKMGNLIGHELIHQQFVECGFEGSNFLGQPSQVPNYEEKAEKATPSQGYIPAIGFPHWCLEYYRHWISTRHGLGKDSIRCAESVEYWLSKVHSDLPEALSKMRDWTLSGEFKDPAKYSIEVNKLLSIMKVPQIAGWAALKGKESGKPVAVNLEIDDENA